MSRSIVPSKSFAPPTRSRSSSRVRSAAGKLPSTKLGLIVHAAEHTQRHVGQLLVTVRVLRADS